MLLNNQEVTEKIKEEIKKYLDAPPPRPHRRITITITVGDQKLLARGPKPAKAMLALTSSYFFYF